MKILKPITYRLALILLVSFFIASMDGYLYCVDGDQDFSCNTCCVQCSTLHVGVVTKNTLVGKNPLLFSSSRIILSAFFLYQNPHLSRIERPPIFIS